MPKVKKLCVRPPVDFAGLKRMQLSYDLLDFRAFFYGFRVSGFRPEKA